ncbi:MAG: Gfo/Idh/MocA family oxidoreductase [Pirellulaceae bacterium]|jgi:predicted dehydrogenase|nr:Gfo/Idh/MocA family oxidoreductase [Thermoguttaceae bacterium]MDI9443259.1 Gfo/Idh/MocA family oxidoreductase [Planctomycetota bacterium]NLY98992.1 Gfo/Idh/MocA family oxidoreductase [Pirellulaceae bacterium]
MDQARLFNRRRFLAAAPAAAALFVPRRVLGGAGQTPPSEQLNVAVIGTGGQGIVNIQNLLKHPDVNIAAICDVAEFWDNSQLYYRHHGGRGPAMQALAEHGRKVGAEIARRCGVHVDYRAMLEKAERTIDAVLVAAPNHVHAVAALAAIRAGKGVYCEKPLTHSVYEARRVAEAARKAKVATQMGNQGHSSDDIRRAVEWIRDGAIGDVREVHAWRGGPNRQMPAQRPAETPPVPKGLDWDLWLGPAKERPYHPAYAPLLFHYWWDFGSGTLGNFGCHTLDTAVWALELGHPAMVEASSTPLNDETTPAAAMYHWKFPARGARPPVDLFWYDGGLAPPRPDCLEPERDLPREGGSLIVGDKGALLSGVWSASPRIIPEKRMQEVRLPPRTIPRSEGHHRDWINACKGGAPASANFEYGARLTEIVLLGVAALRVGATLHWDGPNMKAINAPQAEPFLHGHFRKGWEI